MWGARPRMECVQEWKGRTYPAESRRGQRGARESAGVSDRLGSAYRKDPRSTTNRTGVAGLKFALKKTN